MSDGIKIPITVDDKDAVRGLNQLKERVSKVGSSVSGLGFALGSASTKMGGFIQEAGNLVGAAAAFGGVGIAIAGISAGLAKLVGFYTDHQKAEEEALKSSKTRWDTAKKAAEEAERAVKNYGRKSLDVAKLDAEIALDKQERIKEAVDREIQTEAQRVAFIERRLREGKNLSRAEVQALRQTRVQIQDNIDQLVKRQELEAGAVGLIQKQIREIENLGKKEEEATKKAEAKKRADAAARKKPEAIERSELGRLSEAGQLNADILGFISDMNKEITVERTTLDKQAEIKRVNLLMETFEKQKKMQRELNELAFIGVEGIKRAHSEVADFALSELLSRADVEIRLAEAKKRGDKDRIAELKEERLQAEETMVARIAERLSNEAIGTGSILIAEGLAKGAMGNPGGFVAAGIGGALVAAGIAGTIGSGVALSAAGAAAETRAYNRRQDRTADTTRATGAIGAGRAQGSSQTVINYYFGGPVFGNGDDAARAVARFNDRGRRLEGRP